MPRIVIHSEPAKVVDLESNLPGGIEGLIGGRSGSGPKLAP
jgi:hypothetical protein